MSWNVFSLVFWKPRATTTYCWCFVFDVVMCCGMKLLKPTCYFLNEGEVHKWIGGDRKKDGNFKIYLMAGSFLLCMRVSACVCLRERNGWRSWKNPQRWSRCSIFFFSTLHFCSSSFLGFFFLAPTSAAAITRAEMEMSCAHRPHHCGWSPRSISSYSAVIHLWKRREMKLCSFYSFSILSREGEKMKRPLFPSRW